MKKAAVIGHFANGLSYSDGQTVKTKTLTQSLCDHYGAEEVLKVDTHGWSRNALEFVGKIRKAAVQAENLIMMPAQNGLKIIAPLLYLARHRCAIHYVVVGGWLPELIKGRRALKRILQKFDGIYVETQTMKRNLEDQGFANVMVMPNCKVLQPLSEDTLVYTHAEPYKLCTFSRVMKEKGIGDAVDAVQAVNTRLGRRVYELDIFGPVDPGQKEWFASLQKRFPDYIRYGGGVPFDQSVETLKAYYALLFPTRFYTEGVPGTILDAYAAGIPVIAARWESYADIVSEATGIGYPFDQPKALENILLSLAEAPAGLNGKKAACLRRFREYTPDSVINILLSGLDTSG